VTLQIEYVNTGTVDMASPVLGVKVKDDDFQWRIPGTDIWVTGNSMDFLAMPASGERAVLRPGEKVTISIQVKLPQDNGNKCNVHCGRDWSCLCVLQYCV